MKLSVISFFLLLSSVQAVPDIQYAGYYSDDLIGLNEQELISSLDEIPPVNDEVDCSIRSAFVQWALKNAGYNATFCYRQDSMDGDLTVYHIYLKVDATYGDEADNNLPLETVYLDCTMPYPYSVITRGEDEEWYTYNKPHEECDTLNELNTAFKNMDSTFNSQMEYAWWEYSEVVRVRDHLISESSR